MIFSHHLYLINIFFIVTGILSVLLTQLSRYLSLVCSLFLTKKYFFLILQPGEKNKKTQTENSASL